MRALLLALHVADVSRAAVRLHPQQFLEIDGLTFCLPLFGPFLSGIHQCLEHVDRPSAQRPYRRPSFTRYQH